MQADTSRGPSQRSSEQVERHARPATGPAACEPGGEVSVAERTPSDIDRVVNNLPGGGPPIIVCSMIGGLGSGTAALPSPWVPSSD